jgi:hypothetical protein
VTRAALAQRLAVLEQRAAQVAAKRFAFDFAGFTDEEMRDFEVAMLVRWSGLTEDEAWCAVHDGCCIYHPYDATDPRTADAARAAIKRRLDFLCGYLPNNPWHRVPAELTERLRDLRVWRRVIARSYELDEHGPSYEGRVAQALAELLPRHELAP